MEFGSRGVAEAGRNGRFKATRGQPNFVRAKQSAHRKMKRKRKKKE